MNYKIKKIIIFISIIFISIISFSYLSASNHYVSGKSSVDGGEIRYDVDFEDSGYYSKWNYGKNKWNNYGNINIASDTWWTAKDLDVYDIDIEWSNAYGRWVHYTWYADDMQINDYLIDEDDLSSNEIKNVMIHELGHTLGLAHSISGNVMYKNCTSQIWLGTQDKSDYDYLWD